MAYRFKAHIIIHGQITCLSGLHIGGSEEQYCVGGPDNPVIRDAVTGNPYIPGSSLKGAMRSLLEWMLGKIEADGSVHGRSCRDSTCAICRIFGSANSGRMLKDSVTGPTRLLVRDAFPSTETLNRFQKDGVFLTEQKAENRLNRITAEVTSHLSERVPKGAQFDLDMVYGIYDLDDGGLADIENLKYIYTAFDLLEAGAIGGGGSRGSGKIAIQNLQAVVKTGTDYQACGDSRDYPTVAGGYTNDLPAIIRQTLGLADRAGASAS